METNQEPSSGIERDFPEAPRLAQTNEANLLWD
jgi:hypothetical protein